MQDEIGPFVRRVVQVEPSPSDEHAILTLECAHRVVSVALQAPVTHMPCAQCVNEYVESRKTILTMAKP